MTNIIQLISGMDLPHTFRQVEVGLLIFYIAKDWQLARGVLPVPVQGNNCYSANAHAGCT